MIHKKVLHAQKELKSIFNSLVDGIPQIKLVKTCHFYFLFADLWRLLLHAAPEGFQQVKRHPWNIVCSFNKGQASMWLSLHNNILFNLQSFHIDFKQQEVLWNGMILTRYCWEKICNVPLKLWNLCWEFSPTMFCLAKHRSSMDKRLPSF